MNPTRLRHGGAGRPRLLGVQLHLHRRQDARPLLLPVRRLDPAGDRAGARRPARSPAGSIMRGCSGCSSSASLHFYFIWFGDILAALRADRPDRSSSSATSRCAPWSAGAIGFCSSLPVPALRRRSRSGASSRRPRPPRRARAPRRSRPGAAMQEGFAPLRRPGAAPTNLALYRGPYAGLVHDRLIEQLLEPFNGLWFFGCGDARLHAARHGGAEIGLLPRRMGGRRATANAR